MVSNSPNLEGILSEFVEGCEQPALIDAGEEPFRLVLGCWSLSEWNGRVVLQAWDDQRNLVRKVTGVKDRQRHRLILTTERFPKAPGEMQICDLAGPEGREAERRGTRVAFRERFHRMLLREFPSSKIADLSTEQNLEESLTPAYARAFLRMGPTGTAAIGIPPDNSDPGAAIAFGLIWLDYLRRREPGITIRRLLFFTPQESEALVFARSRWLRRDHVDAAVLVYDARDRVCSVDDPGAGNANGTLLPCRRAPESDFQFDLPGVDCLRQSDGSVRFEVKGLEFARWSDGKFSCGIGRKRRCSPETVAAMAREVVRVRAEENDDRQHPLYLQYPEGWMESQVRLHPLVIDAGLLPSPIYSQIGVTLGLERGIADLLAVDTSGRLAILELKATADLQLPFQALDYWASIRRFLESGEFERQGYFPGVTLLRESPRIFLVAPALEFHSTSETLLNYVHPAIEFIRIGLASDWRRQLRVMFRLTGANRPG